MNKTKVLTWNINEYLKPKAFEPSIFSARTLLNGLNNRLFGENLTVGPLNLDLKSF